MDADIMRRPKTGTWFGDAGRARCQHCGRVFTFQEEMVSDQQHTPPPMEVQQPMIDAVRHGALPDGMVRYTPMYCPECGSKQTKVARKMADQPDMPTIRYHKCKDCAHNFKSIEDTPCRTA
jgi:transposase-like protein